MATVVTAQLLLVKGHTELVFELENHDATIGRDPDCDIILDYTDHISRKHAVMEYEPPRWYIRDFSANGLWLNDDRLYSGEVRPVRDHDIIGFLPNGALKYRFKYTDKVSVSTGFPLSPSRPILGDGSGPLLEGRNHENDSSDDDDMFSGGNWMEQRKGSRSLVRNSSPVPSSSSYATLPPTPRMMMTEEEIDRCKDMELLKAHLRECVVKLRFPRADNEEQNMTIMEQEKYQRHEEDPDPFNSPFNQEMLNTITRLLDTEFGCSICNNVFIKATVIDCGHTFCEYCINQWARNRITCPFCRTVFQNRSRHIELENFVTKLFEAFPEHIKEQRKIAILEREQVIQKAIEGARIEAVIDAVVAGAGQPREAPGPRRHRRRRSRRVAAANARNAQRQAEDPASPPGGGETPSDDGSFRSRMDYYLNRFQDI